jgi:hypothetical protein
MHPYKDIGIQILKHLSTTALANEVKPQKMELNYPPTGAEIFQLSSVFDSREIQIVSPRIGGSDAGNPRFCLVRPLLNGIRRLGPQWIYKTTNSKINETYLPDL